jgi:hypothetical protein
MPTLTHPTDLEEGISFLMVDEGDVAVRMTCGSGSADATQSRVDLARRA